MKFCDFIEDVFALSSFVITRGGANSLFELVALSKPCVCVPLEKGSRGDQVLNASYFTERGAIESVRERDLSFSAISSALCRLEKNKPSYLRAMQAASVDGTMQIVDILSNIIQAKSFAHAEKRLVVKEKS